MNKCTQKVLIDYVEQHDLCMRMYGMGACDEKELTQGLDKVRSDTENKLINLSYERVEALLLMAQAMKDRAELMNFYQGGIYE